MLSKIDARIAASLHRAKNDTDFTKLLSAEVGETLKQLAHQKDDVLFRQLQGKVQFLFELRELIENSAALAAKLGA